MEIASKTGGFGKEPCHSEHSNRYYKRFLLSRSIREPKTKQENEPSDWVPVIFSTGLQTIWKNKQYKLLQFSVKNCNPSSVTEITGVSKEWRPWTCPTEVIVWYHVQYGFQLSRWISPVFEISILLPIPKKDEPICGNHQGISFIGATAKSFGALTVICIPDARGWHTYPNQGVLRWQNLCGSNFHNAPNTRTSLQVSPANISLFYRLSGRFWCG